MSRESRQAALDQAGLVHPRPGAVTAELFSSGGTFFFAADKVQVKYEMLRAVAVDGETVVAAARCHGYSRAGYYLVQAAFGPAGDGGPGRRAARPQGADQAPWRDRRLLARRTRRALRRRARQRGPGPLRRLPAPAHRGAGEEAMRSLWPPAEAAQADYEALRAAVLAGTPLADADQHARPGAVEQW